MYNQLSDLGWPEMKTLQSIISLGFCLSSRLFKAFYLYLSHNLLILKMKKNVFLLAITLFTVVAFAQKKEKIKGTKVVTFAQKEIGSFESLEISDNLEIFLIKGDKCALEIEADENLHEIIAIDLKAGNLRLSTTKEVTNSKKFSLRVTYTDDFNMLVAKDDANITTLTELNLSTITIKTFDNTKLFSTIKANNFILMANDKSKIEINLTADETAIELSKNAQMKALISSPKMKFDMYQKAVAAIEGDVTDLKLRLDNNANFTGKNLTSQNAEITIESYTSCSIQVTTKAIIDAGGKSELQLYGEPKIEIRKFTDSAIIAKKPVK